MAPPQLRGRLNQLFQVILTFAIFAAQVLSLPLVHYLALTCVQNLAYIPDSKCCLLLIVDAPAPVLQ